MAPNNGKEKLTLGKEQLQPAASQKLLSEKEVEAHVAVL